MRSCHYQDRPGKRSLCLRRIDVGDSVAFQEMRWKICDGGDDCPHRNWDQGRRMEVTHARSDLLGTCGGCGRRHDLVMDQMSCHLDRRIDLVLEEMSPPEGSKEPLLDQWFPRSMRDRAWRRVRTAVVERDCRTCLDCGRDLKEYPSWYTEVHHIVPVVDGGSDHPSNLVTLCVECHGAYTDEMCRQIPNGQTVKGLDGDSHRRKAHMSQSVLGEDFS